MAFVDKIWNNLSFVSPDPVVNTAFAFAKVRAAESIFATGGGFMHSPGGESYYAAVWANDQAEYANPFFPFLDYDIGNASALNPYPALSLPRGRIPGTGLAIVAMQR